MRLATYADTHTPWVAVEQTVLKDPSYDKPRDKREWRTDWLKSAMRSLVRLEM